MVIKFMVEEKKKDKKIDLILYFGIILIQIFLMFLSMVFFSNTVNAIVSVCIGLGAIFFRYFKTRKILCPITVLCIIWMILVGCTSFEFPLMRQMNSWDWLVCELFVVFFSLGGILSIAIKNKRNEIECQIKKECQIEKYKFYFCLGLIVLSICIHLYQVYVYGGFVIFSDNPSIERQKYTLPGLATLSTLGTLGVFYIANDKKYRKNILFIVLSILYLGLLFMVSVRFQIFLTIIMVAACSFAGKINVKYLLGILLAGLILVAVFLVIGSVRSGIEEADKYFIQSGLYSGDVKDIVNTEIFRYFGYSQRLVDLYWDHYTPGEAMGAHTLYPFIHMLNLDVKLPSGLWHLGYVATNIVTYLYLDFGHFWPLACVVYGLIVNFSYYNYLYDSNKKWKGYFWAVCCFSLSLSFYSYIHSYIYLIVYFPVVIFLMDIASKLLCSFKYKRRG